MDIEKLQKVNSLARDYVKHGMANSMDDAVRMAEEKIKGQSNMDFIRGDESSDHPQGAPPAQPEPTPPATEQSVLKELTNIVEAQSTQIEQITAKINAIVVELNALKEKVNRPTSPPPAAPAQQEVQTQFNPPAQPSQQSNQKPVTQKPASPRSGNYKPEDVSVENVFYSGTGR